MKVQSPPPNIDTHSQKLRDISNMILSHTAEDLGRPGRKLTKKFDPPMGIEKSIARKPQICLYRQIYALRNEPDKAFQLLENGYTGRQPTRCNVNDFAWGITHRS